MSAERTVSDTESISTLRAWVMATRPKTLAAAAIPVLVGTAVAVSAGAFAAGAAFAAFLGAGLLQIGANLANDYFDAESGADNEDRLGPTRVVQAGLLSPKAVKTATALTFGAATVVGVYLVALAGWPIVAIGVASILAAIAYTGGPYPLGYHGLGELFVFLFFGLVAVVGTYYVQALALSADPFVAAVPVGLLSSAILVVNNYRDIETDRQAGKNTLAVRLGPAATRWQYVLLVAGAYLVPVVQVVLFAAPITLLLPLLSLPVAVVTTRRLWTNEGTALNAVLAQTAGLLSVFGILYAAGYML